MPVSAPPVAPAVADRVLQRADYFHCYLADQPEYLVPERLFPVDASARSNQRLTVSRGAWFSWKEPTPAEFSEVGPLPQMFLSSPGLVWARCPTTGMHNPFWAGPWFREKLSGLRKDAPPSGLTAHQQRVLESAGILVDGNSAPTRRDEWRQSLRHAAEAFQRDGCAALPPILHPFHLGALRRYYRRLLRLGGMALGDSGSPLRYVAYNESVASFFHRRFAPIVSAAAGVDVTPSFAYVVSYQGGACLPVHTDRAQCEFAVSMLIDYVPEPVEQSPWPLDIESNGGWRSIWQCLGDAVLYRGTQLLHGRSALAETATSTSMLFYYVNENFHGSLD